MILEYIENCCFVDNVYDLVFHLKVETEIEEKYGKTEECPYDLPGVLGSYGVTDSVDQLKELLKPLEQNQRKFIVKYQKVWKSRQPSEHGWRWHKWGPYYGTKKPKHEYLYDEGPEFDHVYVFTLMEVV